MPKNKKEPVNTQIGILVSSISFLIAERMNDHAYKHGGEKCENFDSFLGTEGRSPEKALLPDQDEL